MTSPNNTFYIKQNDRLPAIVEFLRNSDGSVPSPVSSVTFHLRDSTGAVKVNAAGTLVDAATCQVSYAWGATDTDTAGTFYREWELVIGGKKVTFPNFLDYPVLITKEIA